MPSDETSLSTVTPDVVINPFEKRAVVTAAGLAFTSGANGSGALALWPMFGAVNQLLAALALLIVTIYLRSRGGLYYLLTAVPCSFMVVMTTWAMVVNESNFISEGRYLLAAINLFTLGLAVWMVLEAAGKILKSGDQYEQSVVSEA